MKARSLPLPVPAEPAPYRGRLLTPKNVSEMIGRSEAWVRRNVPYKVTLGRSTVRWFEVDIRTWLADRRETS